jgi:NCS1 family nucleobase:cation symporter-1
MLAWILSVGAALYFFFRYEHVQAFYMPLPAWLACGVLYIVFSKLMNRSRTAAQAT